MKTNLFGYRKQGDGSASLGAHVELVQDWLGGRMPSWTQLIVKESHEAFVVRQGV